jgi:Glycosyl transferases group 1
VDGRTDAIKLNLGSIFLRVLSVVRKGYYGSKTAVEPMYLYLTVPLRQMGHQVETFDHYDQSGGSSKAQRTELLLKKIQAGPFDLVVYTASGKEPVEIEAIGALSKKFCIVAWNSDDDWQWPETSTIAHHFTFMITTYPHIYESNRQQYPNLLLSQWACLGIFSDYSRAKDIDFSFAGAIYRIRNSHCRYLRRKAGLVCFGYGARMVNLALPYLRGVSRVPGLMGAPLSFEAVNNVWNRTRVSYCPMRGGPRGDVLSIKSRTFDMGLSGTLMLCEHSPNLERYYEPGKECITFENLDDCADKAAWYLAHEDHRARIARNYRDRTLKEHLWKHRFADLFSRIGVAANPARLFPLATKHTRDCYPSEPVGNLPRCRESEF